MTIYRICYIPEACLREKTQPVAEINDELQVLIDDMFETMYKADGVGLAAPQIGISLRLAVIDSTRNESEKLVLINPEITYREGEEEMAEGCLSVPTAYATVIRATKVTVKATDRQGKEFELTAEGLLAEIIQHECDHLDGKLFIDLLSPLKRNRAKKIVEKFVRSQVRDERSRSQVRGE